MAGARFPRTDLGAETVGLAYQRVKPGRRQAFGHRREGDGEIPKDFWPEGAG